MPMSTILLMVVVFVGIAVFYWFKTKGGGAAGYMGQKLGLEEGEQMTAMWMAYFDIERSTSEEMGELIGVHTRGKNIMVALTNTGFLTIGDNESDNPPMRFKQGKVAVQLDEKKAEVKKIPGSAKMEKAVVMRVEPADNDMFKIQIAQSGYESILAWSKAA